MEAFRLRRNQLLNLRDPVNYNPRHGRNNLAFVCMIGRESHEHELRATGQFDVRGVVPSRAGPAGF